MNNTQENSNQLITALFKDHHQLGQAYNSTLKMGYTKDEINILMSEDTKQKHYKNLDKQENIPSDNAIKGAGVGGSLGVTTGLITGAIMAVGASLMISGLGIAIAGPIAAGLAGAGAGGVAGGLVGALMNIGVKEDKAQNFAEEVNKGGILIALIPHSTTDRQELKTQWQSYGGVVLN